MNAHESFKEECRREVALQSTDPVFRAITAQWITMANAKKYSYHFDWLGRPIIQYPQDIVAIQELIWRIKPDLIIETGIAHGGSLVLSASMLSLLDYCDAIESGEMLDPLSTRRMVVGVDIDIREHNRQAIEKHPMSHRIRMIEGSSVDQATIDQVHEIAARHDRIVVFLDANRAHDHVWKELEAYASIVTVGSYCVVFNTIIEDLPPEIFSDRPWGNGNNPKTAVWQFLQSHPEFEVDGSIENKLLISVCPDGYLLRTS